MLGFDKDDYKKIVESDRFCAYPFVQLSTVPAGFMRPCCFFTDMLKNDDGTKSNVSKNTFHDVWNNQNYKEIRTNLLENKTIHGCRQCHIEDSFGGDSMRKRSLREWTWRPEFEKIVSEAKSNSGQLTSEIKFLELKPGNLCNLKCRMCNQYDSSKYASELKDIGAKFKDLKTNNSSRLFEEHNFEFDFDLSKMADWKNNPSIWSSFEKLIPQMEILSFAGGEPTLIEEVYVSLKKCADLGYAKNITVYFASNFTQKMDRFIDLASQFKRFDFIASIDGAGVTQEYIRYPSKWDLVSKNFADVSASAGRHTSINVMINLTLNIYNILTFTELLYWLEKDEFKSGLKEDPFNLNILMFPGYLSLKLLPESLKPVAIEKIQAYMSQSWILKSKSHIEARFNQLIEMLKMPVKDFKKELQEFWIYTHLIDKVRNQKLIDIMPDLHSSVLLDLESKELDPQKLIENII